MPCAPRPWIWEVGRDLHRATHAARARAGELIRSYVARGHQPRAGRLSQDPNRIVIVRRRAKAAVPPCVVKRIRQNALESRGGNVRGHLVTNQTDLPQQQWVDAWIRRIVK